MGKPANKLALQLALKAVEEGLEVPPSLLAQLGLDDAPAANETEDKGQIEAFREKWTPAWGAKGINELIDRTVKKGAEIRKCAKCEKPRHFTQFRIRENRETGKLYLQSWCVLCSTGTSRKKSK